MNARVLPSPLPPFFFFLLARLRIMAFLLGKGSKRNEVCALPFCRFVSHFIMPKSLSFPPLLFDFLAFFLSRQRVVFFLYSLSSLFCHFWVFCSKATIQERDREKKDGREDTVVSQNRQGLHLCNDKKTKHKQTTSGLYVCLATNAREKRDREGGREEASTRLFSTGDGSGDGEWDRLGEFVVVFRLTKVIPIQNRRTKSVGWNYSNIGRERGRA